jgi:hypothetical protein
MTFQEQVIAKLKELFPNAEIKHPIVIDKAPYGYGLAQNENTDEVSPCEYAYSHRDFRFESGLSQLEAESRQISEINKLGALRHPDIIFIRNVEIFNRQSFSKDGDNWSSWVRFVMGYKI